MGGCGVWLQVSKGTEFKVLHVVRGLDATKVTCGCGLGECRELVVSGCEWWVLGCISGCQWVGGGRCVEEREKEKGIVEFVGGWDGWMGGKGRRPEMGDGFRWDGRRPGRGGGDSTARITRIAWIRLLELLGLLGSLARNMLG